MKIINLLLHFMNITCIYINNDKIIEVIKNVITLQTENIILKSELIDIIKNNFFFNNKRYTVLSILKYNIFK